MLINALTALAADQVTKPAIKMPIPAKSARLPRAVVSATSVEKLFLAFIVIPLSVIFNFLDCVQIMFSCFKTFNAVSLPSLITLIPDSSIVSSKVSSGVLLQIT